MDRKVVEGIPINGKKFEAKIHGISNSGNGLIETTQTNINLGPVKPSAVGTQIEAMKLPGPFARINRPKKILKSNYISKLQDLIHYDFSIDYGDAHHNISKHGLRKQEKIGAILEYIPDKRNSPEKSENISTSNKQNQNKEDPLYHRPIIDVNKYGNGIVQINDNRISIGPVRENVVGHQAAVIPIGDDVAVCKTLSVRRENYFKNHVSNIDTDLIDTLNHFEVGMTVRDRQEEFVQDAVIVNLPPIAAKDYVVFHNGQREVTVENKNPEYDGLVSVVVVVREEILQEQFPEYDGDTIPLKTLSEQGIEHYAYHPERLRPREDNIPDYDALKSVSEIGIGSFPESITDISPSNPDDVLAEQDTPYKYKTNLDQSQEAPSKEKDKNNTQRENIDSSAVDRKKIKQPDKTEEQETGKAVPSSKTESIKPSSEPSELRSEESTDDRSQGSDNTPVTDSSTVDPDHILTEETSGDNVKEDTDENSQSELSLDELRERAKEDEGKEISQTSSATTEKTQHRRSPLIKKYVKTRADGYCEGCGKPAPFTSKTGDPYLHAHHVHELSDGGSDTVDAVIALCPNCHYRVHHGENGETYNQELLEKIQRLEDD